jgi:hypothetical protein
VLSSELLCATENSVRINQHRCRTRIADLVDALSLLASTSLRTGSLCLVLSSSAPKCRESVSRKNAVLDQQEFRRIDQGEAAFPLQEGKHRCNWFAPAKRRVADIGGVIPRPAQALPRAPVPAVRQSWAPGRLCPRLNAYGTVDSRPKFPGQIRTGGEQLDGCGGFWRRVTCPSPPSQHPLP